MGDTLFSGRLKVGDGSGRLFFFSQLLDGALCKAFNPFYTRYAPMRSCRILPNTHRCVFTNVSAHAAILNKLKSPTSVIRRERGYTTLPARQTPFYCGNFSRFKRVFGKFCFVLFVAAFKNGGRWCFRQRRQ